MIIRVTMSALLAASAVVAGCRGDARSATVDSVAGCYAVTWSERPDRIASLLPDSMQLHAVPAPPWIDPEIPSYVVSPVGRTRLRSTSGWEREWQLMWWQFLPPDSAVALFHGDGSLILRADAESHRGTAYWTDDYAGDFTIAVSISRFRCSEV